MSTKTIAFFVKPVLSHLMNERHVYTVRPYNLAREEEVWVNGVLPSFRRQVMSISNTIEALTKELEPYTPQSGFNTSFEWAQAISLFHYTQSKLFLYEVTLK